MKKTKTNLIFLTILALACFAIAIVGINTKKADAAIISSESFSDTFDSPDNSYDEKWNTVGDVSLDTEFNAMRITKRTYEWGSHIVNKEFKSNYKTMKNIKLVMTYEMTKETGDWFALSFGAISYDYTFPYSSGAFVMNRCGGSLYMEYTNSTGSLYGKTPGTLNAFSYGKAKIVYEFTSNKGADETNADKYKYSYNLVVTLFDSTDKKLATQNVGKVVFTDGYFGFNTCSMSLDIYDFKISTKNFGQENYNVAYSDDFTTSSVSYLTDASETAEWTVVSGFEKEDVMVGYINTLDLTKKGSGLIYSIPFTKQDNSDLNLLYTLSADFIIDSMNNSRIGFVVGADSNGDNGTFVGILASDSTNRSITYYDDGESACSINSLSGSVLKATLDVYYNNTFVFSCGDQTISSTVQNVDGYFGLINDSDDNLSVGGCVDNFSYSLNTYIDRLGNDNKTGFDDIRINKVENLTSKSYFLPSNTWYVSEDLKLSLYKEGKDNQMVFSNASELTCFGAKTRYKDFIVRFDVTVNPETVGDGSLIGLQFGKSLISEFMQNSQYVACQYLNSSVNLLTSKCSIDSTSLISTDMFSGEKTNFMFVCLNGTLTMFSKADTDEEFNLAKPLAVISSDNTDGYVCFFALSISLNLDNYSIQNLDYHYFSDDYDGGENIETFRYDFKNGKDFSAISTTSKISNGNIDVGDGIETTGKVGANITRFKIYESYGDISIKHGDITIKIDSRNNKLLTTIDGSTHTADLYDFVFDGALFEITELANSIKISYVSGDEPLSAISENYIEYSCSTIKTTNKIKITSECGCYLSNFSVFNLDSNVKIVAKTIVPQTIRIEKEPIQGNTTTKDGGCSTSISSFVIASPILIAFAVLMLIRRKEDRE